MLNSAAQKPWADATRVILPTFKGGGTHVNISAVALARHAPNKANAMKLMEWLTGEQAQQMHANLNFEYPIRAGVPINPTIAAFGTLNAETMPLSAIAERSKAAANLVDKVGFNN
jgi:iron(III) transport system substrate-binding protein